MSANEDRWSAAARLYCAPARQRGFRFSDPCGRTLVVALASSLGLAGCSQESANCDQYHPDPTLQILVDSSLAADVVTTSGACTSATCFGQTQAGCVEWHATMTGGAGTTCLVTLALPTPGGLGGRMSTVAGGDFCGKVIGNQISF